MKKGAGRAKGSGFERTVAKMILKTFGMSAKHAYRTPGSGGHRQASKTDPGDLVISKKLRKRFPVCVECKAYKEIPLYWFFKPEKKRPKLLKGWMDQVVRSARHQRDMFPLLVFKGNNAPVFCALPGVYPLVTRIKPKLRFRRKGEDWFLCEFSTLLEVMVKEGEK